MFYDFWVYSHSIGLHFYTLPTIAVAIAAGITALLHYNNQKNRDAKFEEQMSLKLGTETDNKA